MSGRVATNGQELTEEIIDRWCKPYERGEFPGGERTVDCVVHGSPLSTEGAADKPCPASVAPGRNRTRPDAARYCLPTGKQRSGAAVLDAARITKLREYARPEAKSARGGRGRFRKSYHARTRATLEHRPI